MTNTSRRPLFAGVAKVEITPADPRGLLNMWKRPFVGVHDPLFLRALVVDNGINTAAIVDNLVEMMSRY